MDKTTYVAVGAMALAVGAAVLWQRRQQAQAQAAAAPPSAPAQAVVGPPPPPAPAPGNTGKPEVPKALTTAGTITAGVQLQNALGNAAESVAGKGIGDVARVAPALVGVGAVLGKGAQQLTASVGAPKGVSTAVGVATAAGVVLGAPVAVGAASVALAGAIGKGAITAVVGDAAYKRVSAVVSQFDPTRPGSIANKPVAVASAAVKGVGKVLGKIF